MQLTSDVYIEYTGSKLLRYPSGKISQGKVQNITNRVCLIECQLF